MTMARDLLASFLGSLMATLVVGRPVTVWAWRQKTYIRSWRPLRDRQMEALVAVVSFMFTDKPMPPELDHVAGRRMGYIINGAVVVLVLAVMSIGWVTGR